MAISILFPFPVLTLRRSADRILLTARIAEPISAICAPGITGGPFFNPVKDRMPPAAM